MAEVVEVIDPNRVSIMVATGRLGISSAAGMVILTFTQLSPRAEGIAVGLQKMPTDCVVVARIGLPPKAAEELASLIGKTLLANSETASGGEAGGKAN